MRMLFALLLAAGTALSAPVRMALVIGNNTGLADEIPLRYAADDARRMYGILTELGGADPARSMLLLDRTADEVRDAFQRTTGRIQELRLQKKQVQLFVYFSGHGSNEAVHLRGDELPVREVRTFFDDAEADVKIFIADACFSGALVQAKGGSLAPPADIRAVDDLGVSGSAIITSSSAGELSLESRELKGALFTHYLESALRGAADYDRNRRVSLSEAYTYARVNTLRRGSRIRDFSQNPAFSFDIDGTGDVELTHLDRGERQLTIAACPPGRYLLVDEHIMRTVSEINLQGQDTVALALPPGTYTLQRPDKRRVYLCRADLTWRTGLTVTARDLQPYPLDVMQTKGSRRLVIRPAVALLQSGLVQAPGSNDAVLMNGASIQYAWFRLVAAVSAAYGTDRITGTYLDIPRTLYRFGAELRYRAVYRSRWQVYTGAAMHYLRLSQKPVRHNEDALRMAGYPALPVEYATAGDILLPLGVQLNLPWRVVLDAGLNPGLLLYYESDGTLRIRSIYPFNFAAGIRF